MDIFSGIIGGFATCLTPMNLLYCFIGVFVGTLIGVLPGIGPVGTISLLLPATFHVEPVSAIIMLAGIYYGAMYGGSTTSILVNIPGEAASVITCLDGYQMARKGRAGAAPLCRLYTGYSGERDHGRLAWCAHDPRSHPRPYAYPPAPAGLLGYGHKHLCG